MVFTEEEGLHSYKNHVNILYSLFQANNQFSRFVYLLGTVLCLVTMFLCNVIAAIATIGGCAVVAAYIKWLNPSK